jgi:asparagine synthase (glutamine-hydrolysing)
MCGICGFAGRFDPELIQAMTDRLAHRGPDGEGVEYFAARDGRPPAALGHRRLSILDPTPRGHQPMATADGRYWISYNGELYNFRELRAELDSDGRRFATDCDTEVLLAMYARHGEAMMPRLNGIYAFAIWDAERHELFLARDRLGVKPLYLAEHDGALHFASEVKALLPALPPARLRPTAISELLTFLWVPDPDTAFEGISVLPAGHCARWDRQGLRVRQWWDLSFEAEERSERAWATDLHEALGSAVRRQMVSDVPLGAFLSGGLDSSAIVAEMASAAGRVTTYTVGFSDDDLAHEIASDDVRYSRLMAQKFDVDYHEQILRPEIVDHLPQLVWHLDEPIADPAIITTYLICAAAREQLTVVLSGMGGDELWAGYPRYAAARVGQLAGLLPSPARRALRWAIGKHLTMGPPGRWRGPRRNLMKLARGLDADAEDRHLIYRSYYWGNELERLLSDDLRAELRDHDPFHHHRRYFERVRDEHWLNQLLYVDCKTFLPCLNLTYTDKMSMAASTEVRVPLLDDELVELSARVPPALKLHRLKRKYLLKRSMEGVLPHDVIWRPKAGFGAPLRSWMRGALRPLLEDLVAPDAVRARGLFDPTSVQRLLEDNDAGREDNSFRLWTLLTLELWQRCFVDGDGAPPPVTKRPVEFTTAPPAAEAS